MTHKTLKSVEARTGRWWPEPSWPVWSRDFLDIVEGGAKIAAVTLTAPVLRGSYSRWGATSEESASTMLGDELVPAPKITSTRAITINAPPHEVWAWLVQIGQGRGGFYSGADPKTRAVGPIPARSEDMASTWQWTLRPVDGGRGTQLVVRQRYSYPRRQSMLWHLVEAVSFVMERHMLVGIKARAEGRHAGPSAQASG